MWNCARLFELFNFRTAGGGMGGGGGIHYSGSCASIQFSFIAFIKHSLIRHRALHAPDSTFKTHYIFRLNKKWMANTHPPNSQKSPICYISFPSSRNIPFLNLSSSFFKVFLFVCFVFSSLFTLPRSTNSPNASIGLHLANSHLVNQQRFVLAASPHNL